MSDRLRPDGIGFGVGWIHVYPSTIFGPALEEAERVAVAAVAALGLEDGMAFPQLLVTGPAEVLVVEVAARVPGGQMADLARHAIGVDIVEIAIRQALGDPVPDELVTPRFSQPLAIRFLTAEPGPLPTGRVQRIGPLDEVLASPVSSRPTSISRGRGHPPGTPRRRSARLRDRGRGHRTSRRWSGLKQPRPSWTSRSA